jgi:hypothetical protein
MAYFIFLKYLRSLEEFRKILMSKFLLNLLVQIYKALVYSKIKFYSEKNFSVAFDPSGLSAQPRSIFFSFPPAFFPRPHWASASQLAHLALTAQPTARMWRPAGLPPPTREDASSHAAFALSAPG